MKHVMKKLLLVVLAALMAFSIFACNKGPTEKLLVPNQNPNPMPALNEYGRPESGEYSYRTYMSEMPKSWNPFEQNTTSEQTILSYQSTNIVNKKIINDDGDWEWEPGLATKLPEDVTTDYAGENFPYNIPEGAKEGYAYKITLRQDIKWDNGDLIKAEDFIESLKIMIDPQYSHHRYNSYFQGSSLDIANLQEYYMSLPNSIQIAGLEPNSNFDDVGLKTLSEYELLVVFDGKNNELMSFNNMPALSLLVHLDSYFDDAVEITDGDYPITMSKYMTDASNSRSYGPYKLVSMQHDVEMIFEKNDKWFGWTDSKYNGQYWTTKIIVKIIKEPTTAMMEFKKGTLDTISLTADTYPEFQDSSYILSYPSSVTFQLYMNSNESKLNELEGIAGEKAKNLKYLSNTAFRNAISLAINRDELVSKATAGWESAAILLNGFWEHDAGGSPGEKYRDTRPAMESLAKYFGIENYATMTDANLKRELAKYSAGYDKNKAVELFDQAVEEVGNGTAPDKILIRVHAADSPVWKMIITTMNDIIKESTKGSKLENKLEFVFATEGGDTYGDLVTGAVECWLGAYAYPYIYPDAQIWFMVDPSDDGLLTFGAESFTTTTELTFEIKGEEDTRTLQDWGIALADGDFDEDLATKIIIMAEVERVFAEQSFLIPLASRTTLALNSGKIKQRLTKHSSNFDYGTMRYFEYLFTDAQWEAYTATGKLDYTK